MNLFDDTALVDVGRKRSVDFALPDLSILPTSSKRNRMDLRQPFEIELKGETVTVIPRKVGRDYVYLVDFPYRRPPLMLTKAIREGGGHFWTTVPEEKEKSRQEVVLTEAAVIGSLITKYYASLI